jgi:hypothetical protein
MGRAGLWWRFFGVGAGYSAAGVAVYLLCPAAFVAPLFVVCAIICVLGLTAMARPVMRLRLPPFLRRVRDWELRHICRPFGVPAFGRLLRTTPLRYLNMDVYRRSESGDFARLGRELEAAEVSHLVSATLVVPYMGRLIALGDWLDLFRVSVAQVVVNALPVMHLRYTRWRLCRLGSWRDPRL